VNHHRKDSNKAEDSYGFGVQFTNRDHYSGVVDPWRASAEIIFKDIHITSNSGHTYDTCIHTKAKYYVKSRDTLAAECSGTPFWMYICYKIRTAELEVGSVPSNHRRRRRRIKRRKAMYNKCDEQCDIRTDDA